MKNVSKKLMTISPSFSKGSSSSVRKQNGFSLIEVMIAAMILSTALLGISGLQIISMKGTQQSLMKQHAMNVVHNTIERMRANPLGVIAEKYTVDDSASFSCSTSVPGCRSTNCSAEVIAKKDMLNIICGKYFDTLSNDRFTNGVKTTNDNDKAILSNGTLTIACATANALEGIKAKCASSDVVITVGWIERAFDKETTPVADSIRIQTRIGQ